MNFWEQFPPRLRPAPRSETEARTYPLRFLSTNPPMFKGAPATSIGDVTVDVALEAREVYRDRSRPPSDATAAIYEYLLGQVDERIGFAVSLGLLSILAGQKKRGAAAALAESKEDTLFTFRLTDKSVDKWTNEAAKKIMARVAKAKKAGIKLDPREATGAVVVDESVVHERFSEEGLVHKLKIAPGTVYFASGSNHQGEMYGFAELGKRAGHRLQFGIAVSECMRKDLRISPGARLDSECMNAVVGLARDYPHTRIFVDSGAFSEVVAHADGPPTLNPKKEIKARSYRSKISSSKSETILGWDERLAAYLVIAEAYGPRAFLVAPDLVANQKRTLARMKSPANLAAIRRCAKLGANILVPIQRGQTSTASFYAKVKAIYKGIPVIPALPMKKGATSLEELSAFLDAVKDPIRAIHLLGVGPGGKVPRFANRDGGKASSDEVLSTVRAHPVHGSMLILHDSVLIKSAVGRDLFGLDPRVYTLAQDVVYREIMPEAYHESRWGRQSIEGWVSGEGWGQAEISSHATNLDSATALKWITEYQRERFLWIVDRAERSARAPKGRAALRADPEDPRSHLMDEANRGTSWSIDQWREGPDGKLLGLTRKEKDLLRRDPGAFFRSEAMPWAPELYGLTWSHPQLFGAWLDTEWAHYLAADRAARRKRDAILKAWSIEDRAARNARLEAVAPSVIDAANAELLARLTMPAKTKRKTKAKRKRRRT